MRSKPNAYKIGGALPPRNQEPDRHPQTARPRHTPGAANAKPTAKKKKLSEHPANPKS